MQPADEAPQEKSRSRPAGPDNAARLRQRLLARARAVAEQIRERVQQALDRDAGGRPPGASEPPPSFA